MAKVCWLVQRIGILFVLGFALLSGAWAAPDSVPAWPSEKDLLGAMNKGVKNQADMGGRIWIRSIHEIAVGKKETGLLVSVWFPDRGRNFSAGTFLYRPNLKQAREIDYSRSLGLAEVTGRYGEIALLEQYGSGQGTEDFVHSLVRFDGWTLKELHRAEFANNLGACGSSSVAVPPSACEQTWVKLQLLPSQSDALDLLEITTRMVGPEPRNTSLSTASRWFRLVGSRFKPVAE
ncbi:MAG: hypothetical protein Q8R67_09040 [Rhodoferax sp.]|nr:hypothetical protein [Rhodoferax sp.]MDP3651815.1 hypothetical protein [Rhodoferax sp.]